MKIICYYNKNLKMSKGKLAAQVGHVCFWLGEYEIHSFLKADDIRPTIVVLGLRQNKFNEKLEEVHMLQECIYVQKDLGFTEVKEGTITAFGYIE